MARPSLPLAAAFALTVAALLGGVPISRVTAQTPSFTVEQVLGWPFPEHLTAAPTGATIAWTANERGVRNIYVASGPAFTPRRLTRYDTDDGQELTHLGFTDDGRRLIYVRGGNHDARSPEVRPAPNPAANPTAPKMQVWSITTDLGATTLLGDGDAPVVAPRSQQVAFLREGRIWITPADGSRPAMPIAVNGTSAAPTWSPDGLTLAFESSRNDHGFIALFTGLDRPVRYVAPSTSRDSSPTWSPDGRRIAFVRQPSRSSPLGPQDPDPWAIWVADVDGGATRPAWKSGATIVDSLPRGDVGPALRWGADRLLFLSYHDGWQHLYSVAPSGGPALLLTPGSYMVEHLNLTPDRASVVFSANTGKDPDDRDRRHLFRVPLDAAAPVPLTAGRGIEWAPVAVGDGMTLAYLSSDSVRGPQPAILPLAGGPPRAIGDTLVPAGLPAARLVVPESVIIRAPDGTSIHGQIFKSKDGELSRPAVVFVHGGPAQQMLLGWHYEYYYANAYAVNQYLASRGFLVLSVNYRLGIGYGLGFQYPERVGAAVSEYEDILAAGRYLQTRPDVDATRIGIWGGSYGGYLAALGLAQNPDVFRAGVDVHGLNDAVMGKLTPSVPGDETGDGLAPAVAPTWTPPVLLVHADDDRNVPFLQTAILEERLLKLNAPVEVKVIPDDVHDFLLFRSWTAVASATAEFFERAFIGRSVR